MKSPQCKWHNAIFERIIISIHGINYETSRYVFDFSFIDYMCMRFPFSQWSIAGVPSSQALPGYLVTAPPSMCVPDEIGALTCGFQTKKIIGQRECWADAAEHTVFSMEVTPVAESIFRPLSQNHISKLEFKNGHISRFCSVFQVIQVVSSEKFFSAENGEN